MRQIVRNNKIELWVNCCKCERVVAMAQLHRCSIIIIIIIVIVCIHLYSFYCTQFRFTRNWKRQHGNIHFPVDKFKWKLWNCVSSPESSIQRAHSPSLLKMETIGLYCDFDTIHHLHTYCVTWIVYYFDWSCHTTTTSHDPSTHNFHTKEENRFWLCALLPSFQFTLVSLITFLYTFSVILLHQEMAFVYLCFNKMGSTEFTVVSLSSFAYKTVNFGISRRNAE